MKEEIRAHEVLHMMEGHSFTEASLRQAIVDKFGEDQLFHTCSASGMNADELISFFKAKGKFRPMDEGFTVDLNKVCNSY